MRNNGDIRIGALHLRMPGSDAAAGARLGRRVADLVAADLSSGDSSRRDSAPKETAGAARHFGSLRVRVSALPGTSEAELAERIARALRNAIR